MISKSFLLDSCKILYVLFNFFLGKFLKFFFIYRLLLVNKNVSLLFSYLFITIIKCVLLKRELSLKDDLYFSQNPLNLSWIKRKSAAFFQKTWWNLPREFLCIKSQHTEKLENNEQFCPKDQHYCVVWILFLSNKWLVFFCK